MVRCALGILATVALCSVGFAAEHEYSRGEHAYRRTEQQIKVLLEHIQNRTERFRNHLADALDGSGVFAVPGIDPVDRTNLSKYVRNLNQATRKLMDRYGVNETDPASVEQALRWAVAIDGFLWRHHLTPRLQSDWQMLRGDLKELADAYHVPWGWLGPIGHAHRRSEVEMRALIDQIEAPSDTFRKSLDDSLDETSFNGTNAEDNINQFVEDFKHAIDRLIDKFSDADAANLAVHDVLSQAARIDAFMRQHLLTPGAQSDWHGVRDEVDRLANAYHASRSWYW